MKKLLLFGALAMSATTFSNAANIVNLDTQKEYTSLATAVSEMASGETIQLNKSINFDGTINPGEKEITIVGSSEGEDITINYVLRSGATSLRTFVNMNASATGALKIQNLTINAGGNETTTNFIAQANGTLSLENVTVKDLVYNNTNPGMIRLTGTPTSTVLNNVKFENCTSTYDVNNAVAASTLTLKGNCDYSVNLAQAAAFITDGGISEGSNVAISFTSHTDGVPVVKGTTDLSKFTLDNAAKMLAPQGADLCAINYAKILVVNDSEAGKESLGVATLGGTNGACGKITGTSAQIIINEDVDLASSIPSLAGKTVTIAGANPAVTVNLAIDKSLANAVAADTHVTLKDLIVNGVLDSYASYTAQAPVAGSSVSIENVTFQNINISQYYLIRANAGGTWNLDNVSFSNCTGANGNPLVNTNNDGCAISGSIKGLSLRVAAGTTVNAEGLSADSEPIELTIGNGFVHDAPVITNCDDESLFTLTNNGWSLMADNGGIKALENKIVTGIEAVEAEAEGAAEYFDLNGMRVNAENLTPGIYVKRQGGKTSKIAIR
ncbi:MAG: hypothetical protein NC210_04180 [[Clostridium] fimetarium]|nr:hypothetical protein [Alistipes timonensis]MCM1405602.1 hypothetical protein [[Clostridium] fimetarium]